MLINQTESSRDYQDCWGLEDLHWGDTKCCWACSAWRRDVLGDLTGAHHHPRGGYLEDRDRLFTGVHTRWTRHNNHNLKQGKIRHDIRKFFSTVSQPVEQGSREAVGSPALEFSREASALSNFIWSQVWSCFELEVGLDTSQHPFQPECACGSAIPGCSSCVVKDEFCSSTLFCCCALVADSISK